MPDPRWNFGRDLAAGVQAAQGAPAPPRGVSAPLTPAAKTLRAAPRTASPPLVQAVPARPQVETMLDTGHDPARTPALVAPGTLIDGRYEVQRLIGRGGSAEVYRVIDHSSGGARALKLLMPRVGQEKAEARFKQEIRLCRALHHPNLVQVFDAGSWNGRLYYSMELLGGIDLREYMGLAPGRGIGLRPALEIAIGIANGLVAVHAAGIVHRDIKPANVQLVPGEERVKLVDFGIAFATSLPLDLTEPDIVIGTPAYVSPERVTSSAPATPQADLYSLGVILYELLTGERPFAAPSIGALFERILKAPARPARAWVPELPWEVEVLLEALMAKRPHRRPATAEIVLRRLIDAAERL